MPHVMVPVCVIVTSAGNYCIRVLHLYNERHMNNINVRLQDTVLRCVGYMGKGE